MSEPEQKEIRGSLEIEVAGGFLIVRIVSSDEKSSALAQLDKDEAAQFLNAAANAAEILFDEEESPPN